MPNAQSLFEYASTALAAYGNGSVSADPLAYRNSLVGAGMGSNQAQKYLGHFRVIAYFNDGLGADAVGVQDLAAHIPSFGSATVFERIETRERILAIRPRDDRSPQA